MGTIIGIGNSGAAQASGDYASFVLASSNLTLQEKTEYAIDCSTTFVATLPGSATAGSKIKLTVFAGGFPSAKLQVVRNGRLIDGVASDHQLARLGETVVLTYVSASIGWISSDKIFSTDFGVYSSAILSRSDITSYLSPIQASSSTNRHSLGVLTHGVTAVTSGYIGGCYSPSQNRIYLVPFAQANQANWHYIDCATGGVVAYAHGVTAVNTGYAGGVYSPSQNRIYLVPSAQANQANWHYIDCATGSVVAYAHGVTAVTTGYGGGCYSPTQNRIYLVPYAQSNVAVWHFITAISSTQIATEIASHPSFNKF